VTTKAKLVKRPSSVLLPERDADKSPVLECVGLGVTFGGLKAVFSQPGKGSTFTVTLPTAR